MAELFRSDDMWSALADTLAPFFHPKFRVWFAAQREGWIDFSKPTGICTTAEPHSRYSSTRRLDGRSKTGVAGANMSPWCIRHGRSSDCSRIGLPSREVASSWFGGGLRRRHDAAP